MAGGRDRVQRAPSGGDQHQLGVLPRGPEAYDIVQAGVHDATPFLGRLPADSDPLPGGAHWPLWRRRTRSAGSGTVDRIGFVQQVRLDLSRGRHEVDISAGRHG